MARNKFPEQTLEKIIQISTNLFLERGYEQTSIQDILDATKLSKGGLYHHFKSKDEILEAVMQKRSQDIYEFLDTVIQTTTAVNAKEKLKKILHVLAGDAKIHALDSVLSSQGNNPYFLLNGLQTCVNQDAPIICRLMEEGIADGSLPMKQPELGAELFLLLMNFWINPVLFGRNLTETKKRLKYLQSLFCSLGMDIIDDAFIDTLLSDYEQMGAFSD